MAIVKKLDVFVLKKFSAIFFGSFFITLFVFMMQFTWKYVDELVGKGLTLDVLGEFFWYMALSLVPMSLPLAVLLGSLISFGNMGEQLELLAMRAAGVSLWRIMRPVGIIALCLGGTSFVFQNSIAPEAYLKLRALLYSMKQTSPVLEIPEGTFYSKIPNLSIYVQRKNVETGKLYKVMIYKMDQGFDKAQIVVADSGLLQTSDDKKMLVLDLWQGKEYEDATNGGQANVVSPSTSSGGGLHKPYVRQTFGYKRFIIDFDSNFEKMNEDQLRGSASSKNIKKLDADIDSMNVELDSIGKHFFVESQDRYYRIPAMNKSDEQRLAKALSHVTFDSILRTFDPQQMVSAEQLARTNVQSYSSELEWHNSTVEASDYIIRIHRREWHKKFTLSLACLMFFFVGAPLGAIIRKGGLGLPTVVSVIIFIFYYMIDTSGQKMARDGSWNMIYGMWISTMVLFPLGLYITFKSNRDSVVFNYDSYIAFLKRLIGIRGARRIALKEVILETPDYESAHEDIQRLEEEVERYMKVKRLYLAPSYKKAFFLARPDRHAQQLSDDLEKLVNELSNSRNVAIISYINRLPMIYVRAHTCPFENATLNKVCGVVFPVGGLLWVRIWRFRIMLYRDLKKICRLLVEIDKNVVYERDKQKQACNKSV